MPMAYNFNPFKDKIKSIEEWLKKEFGGIRTGQASPSILDGITVEVYGSQMPLNQIANIGIEDAKTLKISPWDASQVKDIERAITVSNLGLSLRTDESCVRASFPQLTAERRTMLMKLAKEKMEEARISLRKERERTLKDIDAQEDAGAVTEDEKKRLQNEVQKMVDAANKSFEDSYGRKEKEISN